MNKILAATLAITALLTTSTSHAGWFSKDPELKHNYTQEELLALQTEKQSALREQDGFVIEDGYVFYLSASKPAKYVSQSSKVIKLILFKQKLIALRNNGSIYILTEDKKPGDGEWYKIGNSALDIVTDDTNLYALTYSQSRMTGVETRGVWVYKGTPGEIIWTYLTMLLPMPCGNSTCFSTIIIPTIAGREIAFTDMNIPGAIKIENQNGKLQAVTKEGKTVSLNEQLK